MSIFMKKSKSANTDKKGNRKLVVVAGILAIMLLGVGGCKSETVETVVPSETVMVESTEDRFAVNEDLDVGYYDEATDSIKTGLSETLSDSERKALTQDLDGELDAPLEEAEEEAVMTEADYELFEGIIAQMKVEIDEGVFPKEFMDTLEEDMPTLWLIGCTDKVYISEKTVEITDYWNAKNKPAPAETKATTKNNNTQTQKTKPAETKAPVKETQAPKPAETKAPTQSNNSGGTQGEMTPEEKAALDALLKEVSQDIKDSDRGLGGSTGLTDDALDVGMY